MLAVAAANDDGIDDYTTYCIGGYDFVMLYMYMYETCWKTITRLCLHACKITFRRY